MKHLSLTVMAGLALLTCTGCGGAFATQNTPADLQAMQQGALSTKRENVTPKAPVENTASVQPPMDSTNYASAGGDCNGIAQKRMAMYDRPDTYPISDQERHDAYLALYSSCMHEHNYQVAGAPGPTNYASQFAALSPAAGGNRPPVNTVNASNGLVSTSSTPGATVVVIGGGKDSVNQLSSLSPSAGGSSPSATVVYVQSPQAQGVTPVAYTPYPPSAPLPVAVPIAPPPVAKGYAPAAAGTAAYMPAGSPTAAYAPVQPQNHMRPTANTMPTPGGPSLAGAEGAASGNYAPSAPSSVSEAQAANTQLENVLEK